MERHEIEHEPVLCEPLFALLEVRPGEVVLDATLGHGGHAGRLCQAIGPRGRLIGFDVDPVNLERAERNIRQRVSVQELPRLDLVRANFSEMGGRLDELGVGQVDVLLADLGLSTDQMLDAQRGLSFVEDGPLDMRLDDRLSDTAADLVNRLPENDLADLIFHLSQERFSRRIAKKICYARREGRIRRTSELVRIVCSALGVPAQGRAQKIHPATRTFLALRLAVNRELENLEALLAQAPERLNIGGRIAIISFHSGEDRIVKQNFLEQKRAGLFEIKTKKPIVPDREEIQRNARSRSSKLRVAIRTSQKVEAA